MGIDTSIEWCDSTTNPQEGCDGCELWHPKDGGTCYAGGMIARWGKGSAAHPDRFDQPEIYPYRLAEACAWPDLTGSKRKGKPWLDELPRCIFVDDMGDTFTQKLDDAAYLRQRVELAIEAGRKRPEMYQQSLAAVEAGGHWLEPFVPMMAEAPHVWMFLTKRPGRMGSFFDRLGHVPPNFILMTSVTAKGNRNRVRQLLSIEGATAYGVSYEPIRSDVSFAEFLKPTDRAALSWVIAGGESGSAGEVCEVESIRAVASEVDAAGASLFVKQLGRRARMSVDDAQPAIEAGETWKAESKISGVVTFKSKGGNPETWPEDIRRREMPAWGKS